MTTVPPPVIQARKRIGGKRGRHGVVPGLEIPFDPHIANEGIDLIGPQPLFPVPISPFPFAFTMSYMGTPTDQTRIAPSTLLLPSPPAKKKPHRI